ARTKRGADGSRALEAERYGQLAFGHERAGRSPKQNRAHLPSLAQTARELDQDAQGGAHGHLVNARPADVSGEAEQARAGGFGRAGAGERSAAFDEDVEDVDQRLDVVLQRRLPEQARLYREWWFVPRLSPLPFDRVEQCGLLAADVRACAAPHF